MYLTRSIPAKREIVGTNGLGIGWAVRQRAMKLVEDGETCRDVEDGESHVRVTCRVGLRETQAKR